MRSMYLLYQIGEDYANHLAAMGVPDEDATAWGMYWRGGTSSWLSAPETELPVVRRQIVGSLRAAHVLLMKAEGRYDEW